MKRKTLYWAGPRCFVASMRHYDLKTIWILEKKFQWVVYYPLQLVADAHQKTPDSPMFGKNGIIRTTCMAFVDKSDIMVTYTGLIWDTGTARELEYAISQDKPILAWSDSSVVYGETFEENGMVDSKEIDKLFVKAIPFNAMDIVFDRYLRLSELYNNDLKEQDLAREINKQAKEILVIRSQGNLPKN